MEDKINKIIFGIRYRRSFRVPDIAGEILDHVLNDKNSPFDADFFTEIADINKGQVLLNKAGDLLSVDCDSLVLTTTVKCLEKEINRIRDSYYPYLLSIINKFGVKNFNRLGMVFEHQIADSNLSGTVISQITNSKISSPEVFELKFSKKLASTEALWKKDVIDYNNVIVSYLKNEDGMGIRLDYQSYFSPEISSVNDLDAVGFVDSAIKYLRNTFYTWNK